MIFNQITILHDKGELPDGMASTVEKILSESGYSRVTYSRPFIPDLPSGAAYNFVTGYLPRIQKDSLIIGLGRGGLIACELQSSKPALNLSVFAINAPTEDEGLFLMPPSPVELHFFNRCSIYSSAYGPIRGSCDWERCAPLAFDVEWLAEGMAEHPYSLCYLISSFMRERDLRKEVGRMTSVKAGEKI